MIAPIGRATIAIAPATEAAIGTFLAGRPAATIDAYRRALVDFFAWFGGPIGAVQLEDLQRYAADLESRFVDDRGPTASVRVRLFAIRRFFRFATNVGWIVRNPAAELRVPKPTRTQSARILSHEDVIRMLICCRNDRDRILLKTLYVTGIRVSELCRLRVDSTRLHPHGYGLLDVRGKGERPRTIAHPPSLYGDLQRVGAGRAPAAPLFTGGHRFEMVDGQRDRARAVPAIDWPMTRNGVQRIVTRAADRANLGKVGVSPHWLRHAHITHALLNKADVFATSRTAGHASVNTTAAYAHATARDSSAFFIHV